MQRNIAIVGSGPAGIYAADTLTKSDPDISVYIFEALFSPYGLVRSGVAPDHSKIKEVTKLFDKTLSKQTVHFLGNIEIGKDVSLNELKEHFDATIFCTGAHQDRSLNVPGEDLLNVNTATNFVGWYNCHPWFGDQNFNLDIENVAVIGQGNVAIDVTRILLKQIIDLQSTDISDRAIKALSHSKVKNVYLIGRRGPLQAAFTDKELKELGEISDLHIDISKDDLILSEEEKLWLSTAPKGLQKNYAILREFSERTLNGQSRTLHIKFFLSPLRFIGESKLSSIELTRNILDGDLSSRMATPTEHRETIAIDLALKSVGYKGKNLLDLPFEEKNGTFKNKLGLIDDTSRKLYASGWIKRGPSGVIGTNKPDSVETVNTLLSELPTLPLTTKKPEELIAKLRDRGHQIINFNDWHALDAEEIKRGQGKSSRKKFLNNSEAMQYLSFFRNA